MAEKLIQDEKTIIEKILQRRQLQQPRISAEKMQQFKAKLGEEIQRSGCVSQEFVDQLMEQVRNGEF